MTPTALLYQLYNSEKVTLYAKIHTSFDVQVSGM